MKEVHSADTRDEKPHIARKRKSPYFFHRIRKSSNNSKPAALLLIKIKIGDLIIHISGRMSEAPERFWFSEKKSGKKLLLTQVKAMAAPLIYDAMKLKETNGVAESAPIQQNVP
jgi:hypothetical protein